VQNVDAAPAPHRLIDGRLQRRFLGDVGLDGEALAAVLGSDRRRFLRRFQDAVDGQHLSAVAREEESRCPAVAQAFARPLPGADDDGDLFRKPHGLLHGLAAISSSHPAPCLSLGWYRARAWSVLRALLSRLPPATIKKLERRGHLMNRWGPWNELAGHTYGIVEDPETGTYFGGADPRSDGAAMGY
jgi:hypothetical protein